MNNSRTATSGIAPAPAPAHRQAGQTVPRAGIQPPPPLADRIATLQRGRDCRAEAAPPSGGRATPHSGSMSAAEGRRQAEKAPQRAEIGHRGETLWDRRPGGTPRRPLAGSEAPARAQPSPVSTPGGQSGRRAPRERCARPRRGGGACCGREPRPRASPRPPAPGQTAPCRPTAPAAARRSHRRAPTGPGLPRRGRAAARGPRRAPLGVDVRRAGRRKRPKPAKSGPATLWDRCPRGTPGRPPAGSEAPARAQPSPVSTLGGQSGDLAPREVGARLLPAGGACCGREPHPGRPAAASLGQTAPCRPTAPAAARRSHRRAPTGPGLPRRGRAAARGPRRAPLGVDVRRAGRRKRPKPAKTGPETAGTDAPEKRLGALRPGLRRQRGANWVPSARWGVRLASWHRASSARGFYLLKVVMRRVKGCKPGRTSYDILKYR